MNKKLNSELSAEIGVDSSTKADISSVRQHSRKPFVVRSFFTCYGLYILSVFALEKLNINRFHLCV